mmetsp:Transcript_15659/g.13704  ORF Transcript_15659/g.13704 Transcript_15659/m.13704 type:complete len:273 (+) Transcript_15659:1-819(+)
MNSKTRRRVRQRIRTKIKNTKSPVLNMNTNKKKKGGNMTNQMLQDYVKKYMAVKNLQAKMKFDLQEKERSRPRNLSRKHTLTSKLELKSKSPVKSKLLLRIKRMKRVTSRRKKFSLASNKLVSMSMKRNILSAQAMRKSNKLSLPKIGMFSYNGNKTSRKKGRYEKDASPTKRKLSTFDPEDMPLKFSTKMIDSINDESFSKYIPKASKAVFDDPNIEGARKIKVMDKRRFYQTTSKGKYSSFFENLTNENTNATSLIGTLNENILNRTSQL